MEYEKNKIVDFQGKILVAEDNEVSSLLVSLYLEKLNIPFDIVSDGVLAVESVKRNTYVLILMDNLMPNMTGKEATLEIREFDKEIGIIALTASDSKEEKVDFLTTGMNDVLVKPLKLDKLIDILQKYNKSSFL